MRLLTGDHPGAADALTHALRLFRDFGDQRDEAYALNIYAALLLATGDQPQALDHYQQALVMNRQQHKPADEATALEGIGECHLKAGDTDTGTAHLRQALEIYQRLGMRPDTDRVRTRLIDLNDSHDEHARAHGSSESCT